MVQKRGKDIRNTCGKRVRIARAEREMTQLQLSAALEIDCKVRIDASGIGFLEQGERFVKDFELLALAEVLNKHPMWLLFGDKLPPKYQ